jgi:hypothetical protein
MIPADVYREFVTTGSAWAEAHCTASQLEDQLKPLLSSLTIQAKQVHGVKSMAEAKEIAQSSSLYRDSITAANDARKESNLCKVRYDATRSLFDAQRTVEATQRAAAGAST